MTAKTITFAVQLGSGGFAVARAVAEKLNYRYYDSEITSRAASDAGVSPATILEAEYAPSMVERILARLGAAGFADADLASPGAAGMSTAIRNLQSDQYRRFIEHVVKELTDQAEAVIVGHAGQVILGEEWGVLKVLLTGSASRRTQRLTDDEHLPAADARKLIGNSDHERVEFFKTVYHVDLLSASLYDLCLNTDSISLDSAVELIVQAALNLPGLFPEPEDRGKGAIVDAPTTDARRQIG
jgi:cytidylate kinase